MLVLINPGASLNFIDDKFVEHKGLKTKDFERFQVSNTNGKLTLVDRMVE